MSQRLVSASNKQSQEEEKASTRYVESLTALSVGFGHFDERDGSPISEKQSVCDFTPYFTVRRTLQMGKCDLTSVIL